MHTYMLGHGLTAYAVTGVSTFMHNTSTRSSMASMTSVTIMY